MMKFVKRQMVFSYGNIQSGNEKKMEFGKGKLSHGQMMRQERCRAMGHSPGPIQPTEKDVAFGCSMLKACTLVPGHVQSPLHDKTLWRNAQAGIEPPT